MEKKLQTTIIKWLKSQGAYVIKTRPGMGTPAGCPDIIALYRWKHVDIEVKSSPTAPYQPGQEATLKFLRRGNQFVYTAYPENWPEIQRELAENFF